MFRVKPRERPAREMGRWSGLVASGLTLLMLTPEIAVRAGLRDGCRLEQAEEVHAGTDARVGVTLTCPTVWFPLLVASFRWW